MQKRWKVSDPIDDNFSKELSEDNGVILQLLYNRGLTKQNEINDFFDPAKHVLDPFLFVDMEKAVDRIFEAIKNKEKVLIFGDYDADGVCSSAILYEALSGLSLDVGIKIPLRETEGYGLNMPSVKKIIEDKYKLVITVDCGISNKDEIAYFKENGVDVIVTDHHQQPLAMPDSAYAVINPALDSSGYPFKRLAGAGVAWKLVQAIMKKQDSVDLETKLPKDFYRLLLDFVAIATVGDIVPLLGENRALVKYGLGVLQKSERKGIVKMIEKLNHFSGKIDTQYIGWRLVPRINAAGRINHASLAFNLLISKDDEECDKLLEQLEGENTERQKMTTKILKEADKQIGEVDKQKMLWAVDSDWHMGVVGLVAGRLSDKYHLPTLVINKKGDKYVGSGRSIDEFDITAGLKECGEYLSRYGGHPQACGFTVIGDDNFKQFQEKLTSIAKEKLKGLELIPVLEIEAEISLADINWDLWNKLDKFEPFGEANPLPLFLVKDLKIEQIQTVGADGKHMRAMVGQEGHSTVHKIIGFSFGEWCAKLNIGDKIDVVFEIGVNEWNGNRDLQLKVIDLKLAE